MKQILEGSQAIAQTIKNIKPDVISAYPITPQTHIVEDLAKFKADGKANYAYVRAESEFAAASIVEGASATGARVYTATSSQGLLLMTEVLFNIAGMRLPVVLTCANRGVSAPITIWNDHQDSMTVRDSGWIMLFAENHQEAVNQHIMAYKIAEIAKLPVMVNVDGFVLTHTYEPVNIPSQAQIKKYLPAYQPKPEEYLDPKTPITMGAFATPAYYMDIRKDLHDKLLNAKKLINQEYIKYNKIIKIKDIALPAYKQARHDTKYTIIDNGVIEYTGPKNPKVIIIAMGSVVGTIKNAVRCEQESTIMKKGFCQKIGVLKIKSFRPFPADEINKIIKKTKYVAVMEKAISLGYMGPLASEIKAINKNKNTKIQSFIVGLGGRDITEKMIIKIISQVQKENNDIKFIGK